MELLAAGGLDLDLLQDFAVALFIGALIGLDREHQVRADEPRFGGLRTFTLCALAGALAGWLDSGQGAPVVVLTGLLAISVLLAMTLYVEGLETRRVEGLTSEVAALVTYLLGAAVTRGHASLAVVLGIAVFTVLTFKKPMHAAVRTLGRDDINAGLKLLAATFIVLPLLPSEPMDPWGALNPYKLWLLVILISSLSLVGYVAVRLLGARRGLALTGLFGGLVSSTAVTLTFARRSREENELEHALALGILVAWAIMFVRVVIEVAVVNAALLPMLSAPLGAMFVASAALLLWLYLGGRGKRAASEPGDTSVPLRNPFNLTSAVSFGLFFAAVLLVVRLAQMYMPSSGIYVLAALTGATDVDAITLSLAESARQAAGLGPVAAASVDAASGGLPPLEDRVAVLGILIAAWSNTLVKCAMVVALGSRALAARIIPATVLVTGAGAATYAALAVLG